MRSLLNFIFYVAVAIVTGWYAFNIWINSPILPSRALSVALGITCIYCISILFNMIRK